VAMTLLGFECCLEIVRRCVEVLRGEKYRGGKLQSATEVR